MQDQAQPLLQCALTKHLCFRNKWMAARGTKEHATERKLSIVLYFARAIDVG